MNALQDIAALLIFPGGLFLTAIALIYQWIDRKLIARLQNRIGPRWFQPLADYVKLLAKEEIVPDGVDRWLFLGLPVVAFAGVLTAAVYVPIGGVGPIHNFAGDLIVTIYLLSLFTMCTGLAGAMSRSRFSLMGAMRTLSQLFSYEAPFLMALLGPAVAAGSWQIDEIMRYASEHPVLLIQPISFAVALIGLMGKLEMPPFDAPEAPSEIVAGPLTEYSGRGLALFRLSRDVSLVVGMTLIAAFYLGGIHNPLDFLLKTCFLLFLVACLQVLFARLRIDQTVGLWWRYGMLLILAQWLVLAVWWR